MLTQLTPADVDFWGSTALCTQGGRHVSHYYAYGHHVIPRRHHSHRPLAPSRGYMYLAEGRGSAAGPDVGLYGEDLRVLSNANNRRVLEEHALLSSIETALLLGAEAAVHELRL